MAVKTYCVGVGNDGNFGALVDGVDQTAANRTDGWTCGKVQSSFSAPFDAGTKLTTAAFTSTGEPQGLALGTTANAFKTPAPLTGTFAATAWTLTFALRATVASSQSVTVQIRVYKSANADGSGATQLTSTINNGGASGALSTSADKTCVITWSPGVTITLNNEYLFIAVGVVMNIASGSNTGDIVIRTGQAAGGSRFVTPDLVVSTPKSSTDANGTTTEAASVAVPDAYSSAVLALAPRYYYRLANLLDYAARSPNAAVNLTAQTTQDNPTNASTFAFNGDTRFAQSFVAPTSPGGSQALTSVRIYPWNSGTAPSDNLVAEIFSDNAGAPGTLLASVGTVAGSTLTGTANPVDLPCSVPVSVGVTYWLVLRRSDITDTTTNYRLLVSNTTTAPNWALGKTSSNGGASWVNATSSWNLNGRFTYGRASAPPIGDQPSLLPAFPARTATLFDLSYRLTVPIDVDQDVGDVFSVEAWIKRRRATGDTYMGILSHRTGSYYLRINATSQLELVNSSTAIVVASTVTIADTLAHHVVATKNGATVKLYIDGADVTGTVTNSTMGNSSNGLYIGDEFSLTETFDGTMQELALYDIALSQAQVLSHYNLAVPPVPISASDSGKARESASRLLYPTTVLTDGPAAYWRMDEAALPVQDISGSGFHLNGGAAGVTQAAGLLGDPSSPAIAFNATNNFINRGGVLFPYNTFTIEMLLQRTVFGVQQCVCENYYGAAIELMGDGTIVLSHSFTGWIASSSALKILDSNTHHLVVTRAGQGGAVTFYLDGVSEAGIPGGVYGNDVSTYSTNGFFVGSEWGNRPFTGTIDELAVYPTVLSAARVTAHYNAAIYVPPVTVSGTDTNGATTESGSVKVVTSDVDALSLPPETQALVAKPSAADASGTVTETASAVAGKPKVQTLVDTFDTALDKVTKWPNSTASAVWDAGERARLPCGATYSQIGTATAGDYDLTGSALYAKLTVPPVATSGPGSTREMFMEVWCNAGGTNKLGMFVSGGNMTARRTVGGATSGQFSAAYNAASHAWWRIRESAGTVFFDVSADGVTWNNFYSVAAGMTVTVVSVDFTCGYYGTETAADGYVDYVNAPAVVPSDADGNGATTEATSLKVTTGDAWSPPSEAQALVARPAAADANGAVAEPASVFVPVPASDSNGVAAESTTTLAALAATEPTGAEIESASVKVATSDVDSLSTPPEQQTLTAALASTEPTGAEVEAATVAAPVAAADANGATTDTATLTKAAVAAVDTNGTVTEAAAQTAAIPAPDANGAVAEAVALRLAAADASGATTEAAAPTFAATATDASGATTEAATITKVALASSDASGAVTEATAQTAAIPAPDAATASESASVGTVALTTSVIELALSGVLAPTDLSQAYIHVRARKASPSDAGVLRVWLYEGSTLRDGPYDIALTNVFATNERAIAAPAGISSWAGLSLRLQGISAAGSGLTPQVSRIDLATIQPAATPISGSDSGSGSDGQSLVASTSSPDANAAASEAASPKSTTSSSDASGATTEAAAPAAPVLGADANAGTTEAVSALARVAADANGAAGEAAATYAAVALASDASGAAGESAALAAGLSAADAGGGGGGLPAITTAGLAIRLDASLLALADGADVTSWPNAASAGLPGPMVGTPLPKLHAAALNGLPAVRFTSSEGRLRMNGTGVGGDWTLAYVARMVPAGNSVGRVVNGIYSPYNILFGFWNGFEDVAYGGAFYQPDMRAPVTSNWKLYSTDGTAGAGRLFSDGVLLSSGGSDPAGLGGTLAISGYDPTTSAETCDCEVAEVVVYDHALTDAERQTVESYLRQKWIAGVTSGETASVGRTQVSSSDGGTASEAAALVAAVAAADSSSVTTENQGASTGTPIAASDANGAVTEAQTPKAVLAAADNATASEAPTAKAVLSAADANGATAESVAPRLAVADASAAITEAAAQTYAATVADANGAVTELQTTAAPIAAADANSATTESVASRAIAVADAGATADTRLLVASVAVAGGPGASGSASESWSHAGQFSDSVAGGPQATGSRAESSSATVAASGGPQAGGSRAEGKSYADARAGSPSAAGSAAQSAVRADAVAGGPQAAGSRSEASVRSDARQGGPAAAGSKAESWSRTGSDVVQGGPVAAGSKTESWQGNAVRSGGPIASGSVVESYGRIRTDAAAGGPAAAGSRLEARVGANAPSGGPQASGSRLEAWAHTRAAPGGPGASGSVVESHAISNSDAPSGGPRVTGGVTGEARSHADARSSAFAVAGSRAESWTRSSSDVVKGGVAAAGSLLEGIAYTAAPSGPLTVGGSSSAPSAVYADAPRGGPVAQGSAVEQWGRPAVFPKVVQPTSVSLLLPSRRAVVATAGCLRTVAVLNGQRSTLESPLRGAAVGSGLTAVVLPRGAVGELHTDAPKGELEVTGSV